MIEKEVMGEMFYFISEQAYGNTVALSIVCGIFVGAYLVRIFMWAVNSSRAKTEAMKKLTDKEYRIVDEIRRL